VAGPAHNAYIKRPNATVKRCLDGVSRIEALPLPFSAAGAGRIFSSEIERWVYKVAVVGATGHVGREMLNILANVKFPPERVWCLASRRSVASKCPMANRTLKVKALEHYDFSDVDICLMSAGGSVSKEWSPKSAPPARWA